MDKIRTPENFVLDSRDLVFIIAESPKRHTLFETLDVGIATAEEACVVLWPTCDCNVRYNTLGGWSGVEWIRALLKEEVRRGTVLKNGEGDYMALMPTRARPEHIPHWPTA